MESELGVVYTQTSHSTASLDADLRRVLGSLHEREVHTEIKSRGSDDDAILKPVDYTSKGIQATEKLLKKKVGQKTKTKVEAEEDDSGGSGDSDDEDLRTGTQVEDGGSEDDGAEDDEDEIGPAEFDFTEAFDFRY